MTLTFPKVIVVKNGQSVTGSFNKIQVMASGSIPGSSSIAPAHFKALKDYNGIDIVSASFGSAGMFVPPGAIIDMLITSASLDATSAPVLFYS